MASITEVAPAIAAPATKNQKLIQWVEEIAQFASRTMFTGAAVLMPSTRKCCGSWFTPEPPSG